MIRKWTSQAPTTSGMVRVVSPSSCTRHQAWLVRALPRKSLALGGGPGDLHMFIGQDGQCDRGERCGDQEGDSPADVRPLEHAAQEERSGDAQGEPRPEQPDHPHPTHRAGVGRDKDRRDPERNPGEDSADRQDADGVSRREDDVPSRREDAACPDSRRGRGSSAPAPPPPGSRPRSRRRRRRRKAGQPPQARCRTPVAASRPPGRRSRSSNQLWPRRGRRRRRSGVWTRLASTGIGG